MQKIKSRLILMHFKTKNQSHATLKKSKTQSHAHTK